MRIRSRAWLSFPVSSASGGAKHITVSPSWDPWNFLTGETGEVNFALRGEDTSSSRLHDHHKESDGDAFFLQ